MRVLFFFTFFVLLCQCVITGVSGSPACSTNAQYLSVDDNSFEYSMKSTYVRVGSCVHWTIHKKSDLDLQVAVKVFSVEKPDSISLWVKRKGFPLKEVEEPLYEGMLIADEEIEHVELLFTRTSNWNDRFVITVSMEVEEDDYDDEDEGFSSTAKAFIAIVAILAGDCMCICFLLACRSRVQRVCGRRQGDENEEEEDSMEAVARDAVSLEAMLNAQPGGPHVAVSVERASSSSTGSRRARQQSRSAGVSFASVARDVMHAQREDPGNALGGARARARARREARQRRRESQGGEARLSHAAMRVRTSSLMMSQESDDGFKESDGHQHQGACASVRDGLKESECMRFLSVCTLSIPVFNTI